MKYILIEPRMVSLTDSYFSPIDYTKLETLRDYSTVAMKAGKVAEVRKETSGYDWRFHIAIPDEFAETVRKEIAELLGKDRLMFDEFYTPRSDEQVITQ